MLSIITPILNGEQFIECNIIAISKLSIPHEHIIVDGGSSDKSLQIISKFPHLRLIAQKGKNGMYSAINQGVTASNGNYISYINCDDIVDPDNFSAMHEILIKSSADFIYSDGYLKNSADSKCTYYNSSRFLFRYLLRNGIMPFNQPCSIYTKKLYEEVGGFNESEFKYCGDIDFFRKIIEVKSIDIRYYNKPTVTFLIHENSLTTKFGEIFYEEYRKAAIPIPRLPDRFMFFISRKLGL